jgi:hypothetical protein
MAWEWVGTAAAGVAGMFFTWLTGKQGRDHAETIASEKLEHDRLIATEARQQQRLENAYIELLDIGERVGQWAQMAYPLWDTNPPRRLPPLPSLAEQARSGALVNAFGSAEVLAKFEAWLEVVQKMLATGRLIDYEDAGNQVREDGDPSPRQVFDLELRPKEAETRRALQDQVAAELGHRRGRKTGTGPASE